MKRSMLLTIVLAVSMTACQTSPFGTGSSDGTDPLVGDSASGSLEDITPGLHVSPNERFRDVPVPVGARFDLGRSFIYESDDLQVGKMVYTSQDSVADLTQFYQRECAAQGWRRLNSIESEGVDLFYEKPGKRLTVSIRGVRVQLNRTLTLTLTPSGTGGTVGF